MNSSQEIAKLIQSRKSFVLVTHLNPDGDGLGSELALAPVLKGLGKEVSIANAGGIPELYHFLPGSSEVKNVLSPEAHFDVAIIFECPSKDRIGSVVDLDKQVNEVINIDHHYANENYGTMNWVVPDASAVGEQIYQLILDLGGEITKDIAVCLFTSIYTDTGGFRYGNTTAAALNITSQLLKCGLKPDQVTSALLEQFSLPRMQLLGLSLATLQKTSDGKIAWLEVTLDMLKRTGCQDSETEGFVDYPRSLRGVEVGLLFKETDQNKTKVSFRSKGRVDVQRLAQVFGGGGHPAAAGCTVAGGLGEVQAKILSELNKI